MRRAAARRRHFVGACVSPPNRQADAEGFLLRYRWACGGVIALSYAMECAVSVRQRQVIDEAIAAVRSGTEPSGSEFVNTLTQDAVHHLVEKLGSEGEMVKTCDTPATPLYHRSSP